jgi:hypothetical protein
LIVSATRHLLEALTDDQRDLWAQAPVKQRRDALLELLRYVAFRVRLAAREENRLEYELRDIAEEESPALAWKQVLDLIGKYGVDEKLFWKTVGSKIAKAA